MSSTYMGDACVITGSYTDENGNNKNRYNKVGAWFQNNESGAISVKLEVLPMPSENGCWISLFRKQNGNQNQGQPQQQRQQPPQQRQQPPQQNYYNNNNDGVPF